MTERDVIRRDLILTLHTAEGQRSGEFIGFKWFRDTYLVERGFAWAAEVSRRQSALTLAIQDGLILIEKRLNPAEPEFGTTAIKLNRGHTAVRRILGAAGGERSPLRPPIGGLV